MAERHVLSSAEPLGIGERLRNAREAKGFTLGEMEGITRIRAIYLQALEDEQFERLPGPVYTKGFLRAYASALGLDPDRVLDTYPRLFEEPSGPIVAAHALKVPIHPTAPRSRLRRIGIYAAILVVAVLVAFGTIGYLQLRELAQPVPPEIAAPAPQPAPPAPAPQPPVQTEPVQPQPGPPPVPPAPPQPEPAQPPATPEPPQTTVPPRSVKPAAPAVQPQAGGVSIEVRATGMSWLRVTADGEQIFQGFVNDGDVRVWRARKSLTLRVGNSPVVRVLVNGQPLRPPADRVWERTFQAMP